jgi:hypothetical protein
MQDVFLPKKACPWEVLDFGLDKSPTGFNMPLFLPSYFMSQTITVGLLLRPWPSLAWFTKSVYNIFLLIDFFFSWDRHKIPRDIKKGKYDLVLISYTFFNLN